MRCFWQQRLNCGAYGMKTARVACVLLGFQTTLDAAGAQPKDQQRPDDRTLCGAFFSSFTQAPLLLRREQH